MPPKPICIGLRAHERVGSNTPDLVPESYVSGLMHQTGALAHPGKRVGVLHSLQKFAALGLVGRDLPDLGSCRRQQWDAGAGAHKRNQKHE
jgi:hypothetical protein